VDHEVEKRQVESLAARRKKRNAAVVASSLDRLGNAAAGEANLFPFILETVNAEATVGEICATLAKHFGRYREQRR
jgi:methylmalonyl-CoA mutase N-terminal domain/subunit